MVFGFLLILTIVNVRYLASTSISNQPTAAVNRSVAMIESRLKQCGAPVLKLQGECLGIAIAQYDRKGCKVIPADIVERLVASAIETQLEPVQPTDLGSNGFDLT